MNEHLAAEYLSLKRRLETRIKELQSKYSDQNHTNITDGSQPSTQRHLYCNEVHKIPCLNNQHCYCQCYCHRSCFCHDFPIKHFSTPTDRNIVETISIREALKENIKVQQQMNTNMKILNGRLSDISMKKSENSNFMDENMSQSKKPIYSSKEIVESKQSFPYERSKSQTGERNLNKPKLKKVTVKSPNIRKKSHVPDQKWNIQYFNKQKKSKKTCPLHQQKDVYDLYERKLKQKQIYKDGCHRNKKHERNHLVSSYKQQQKSKEQLNAKISRNFFSLYKIK